MKIRTRLTFFFTAIFLIVIIALSAWYQYRLYMTLRLESIKRLDEFTRGFFRPGPMDKPEPLEPIKRPPPNDRQMDFQSFLEKLRGTGTDRLSDFFGRHMWYALYDKNLVIIEQSALAKEFPLNDTGTIIKNSKNYFSVKLRTNSSFFTSDNNYPVPDAVFERSFYTDEENHNFTCIGKINEIKFEGNSYFFLTILPDDKNTDYLYKSMINVIFSLIILIFITVFIGFWYSGYSLNPINKLIKDLNNISEKNLSDRILLKKKNRDEISEISKSINNLLDRIENAFAMEKQFISDVSHEFKTPISILQLNMDNLSNNPDLSDEEIDKISSSLEILYSLDFLIRKLLYLSRLETNLCKFNPESFQVKELLETITGNLQSIADLKSIKIILDADEKIFLEGDRELLYIAFYNIIENAIKYTDKGNVKIYANSRDEKTIITIIDSGIGIPKDKLGKIFDKFYRVDQSRNDERSFGIGLTIAKRILDIHNAKIIIKSIEKEMTRFDIYFGVSKK